MDRKPSVLLVPSIMWPKGSSDQGDGVRGLRQISYRHAWNEWGCAMIATLLLLALILWLIPSCFVAVALFLLWSLRWILSFCNLESGSVESRHATCLRYDEPQSLPGTINGNHVTNGGSNASVSKSRGSVRPTLHSPLRLSEYLSVRGGGM